MISTTKYTAWFLIAFFSGCGLNPGFNARQRYSNDTTSAWSVDRTSNSLDLIGGNYLDQQPSDAIFSMSSSILEDIIEDNGDEGYSQAQDCAVTRIGERHFITADHCFQYIKDDLIYLFDRDLKQFEIQSDELLSFKYTSDRADIMVFTTTTKDLIDWKFDNPSAFVSEKLGKYFSSQPREEPFIPGMLYAQLGFGPRLKADTPENTEFTSCLQDNTPWDAYVKGLRGLQGANSFGIRFEDEGKSILFGTYPYFRVQNSFKYCGVMRYTRSHIDNRLVAVVKGDSGGPLVSGFSIIGIVSGAFDDEISEFDTLESPIGLYRRTKVAKITSSIQAKTEAQVAKPIIDLFVVDEDGSSNLSDSEKLSYSSETPNVVADNHLHIVGYNLSGASLFLVDEQGNGEIPFGTINFLDNGFITNPGTNTDKTRSHYFQVSDSASIVVGRPYRLVAKTNDGLKSEPSKRKIVIDRFTTIEYKWLENNQVVKVVGDNGIELDQVYQSSMCTMDIHTLFQNPLPLTESAWGRTPRRNFIEASDCHILAPFLKTQTGSLLALTDFTDKIQCLSLCGGEREETTMPFLAEHGLASQYHRGAHSYLFKDDKLTYSYDYYNLTTTPSVTRTLYNEVKESGSASFDLSLRWRVDEYLDCLATDGLLGWDYKGQHSAVFWTSSSPKPSDAPSVNEGQGTIPVPFVETCPTAKSSTLVRKFYRNVWNDFVSQLVSPIESMVSPTSGWEWDPKNPMEGLFDP